MAAAKILAAKVVLEKEILRMKVVVPSGLTEKHIQQITFVFNHYFDPMYKNCQICHQDLFKRLPLEVDCLIMKIYMSASSTLGATTGNNEQDCFLFHEAKEICLVFRPSWVTFCVFLIFKYFFLRFFHIFFRLIFQNSLKLRFKVISKEVDEIFRRRYFVR